MTLKNPNQLFPLFVSDKLEETKRYYADKLGFTVTFDMPHYLQLRYGKEGAPELCFMRPNGMPDGQPMPEFGGAGVIVSIPTESADAAYDRMRGKGAQVQDAPSDKPWGWRSFVVRDPNGVMLDFFHVYKDVSAADLKG
jgi:catechol 2,3-dioxygenase-like lactoylglutathione lyase family enzyme